MSEQIVIWIVSAAAGVAIGWVLGTMERRNSEYQKAKRKFDKFERHINKKLGLDFLNDDDTPAV